MVRLITDFMIIGSGMKREPICYRKRDVSDQGNKHFGNFFDRVDKPVTIDPTVT
jgi:hypothetical protein